MLANTIEASHSLGVVETFYRYEAYRAQDSKLAQIQSIEETGGTQKPSVFSPFMVRPISYVLFLA